VPSGKHQSLEPANGQGNPQQAPLEQIEGRS
jgi:hypothetical protein